MMVRVDNKGFTLIELSIVLVIIGLIVGGVLVGRDMITAAEIRSAVAQVEKYQTAVNTFRTKYNGLPGDLQTNLATGFGMVTRTSHGTGVYNANFILETTNDNVNNTSTTSPGYETTLFWRDLSFSQLINERFNTANDGLVPALLMGEDGVQQLNNFLPRLPSLTGNYMAVFSAAGLNYYHLAGIMRISGGLYFMGYALTPQQAYAIDQKVDDGRPITGIMRGARSATILGTQCVPTASGGNGDACCGDGAGGSSNIYKTTTTDNANTKACQLFVKFQ
ncbi:MAG: type II secretion system protein [Alphaproteobacteria bacterium]